MYPQAYINKFKFYFLLVLIAYTLALLPLFPKEGLGEIYYELILDFGNDFTFIHETTKSEEHCRFRAITISIKENVNAYCVKREYENSPRPIR